MQFDPKMITKKYRKGESVPTIARKLGISQWVIYTIMRREKILLRTSSQSNRLGFLSKPLTFSKKSRLSLQERRLFIAGLMLYWAEGSKRGLNTVDFANSDPQMIKLFLRLLREVYQVSEEKFRILLYCYANQSVPDLIDFWSALTSIPKNQFTKPYVRADYQIAKADRMPYGMIHVRYNDQRLLNQIKLDIESLTNQLL